MLKRVVLLRRVTFGTILAVAGCHSKEPSLLEVNVHAGNLDGQLVLKQSLSGRETIINTPDKESLVQLSEGDDISILSAPPLQFCLFSNGKTDYEIAGETQDIQIDCEYRTLFSIYSPITGYSSEDYLFRARPHLWFFDGVTLQDSGSDGVVFWTDTVQAFFKGKHWMIVGDELLVSADPTMPYDKIVEPAGTKFNWMSHLKGIDDYLIILGTDTNGEKTAYAAEGITNELTTLQVNNPDIFNILTYSEYKNSLTFTLSNGALSVLGAKVTGDEKKKFLQLGQTLKKQFFTYQHWANDTIESLFIFDLESGLISETNWPVPVEQITSVAMEIQGDQMYFMISTGERYYPNCTSRYTLDSLGNWTSVYSPCSDNPSTYSRIGETNDFTVYVQNPNGDKAFGRFTPSGDAFDRFFAESDFGGLLDEIDVYEDGLLFTIAHEADRSAYPYFVSAQIDIWYYSYASRSAEKLASAPPMRYNSVFATSPLWGMTMLAPLHPTGNSAYKFFTLFDEQNGFQLWVTQGTAESTRLVTMPSYQSPHGLINLAMFDLSGQ